MRSSELITISIILIFLAMLLYTSFSSTDSTDVSKFNRSGIRLYIDNLTGCHYLAPLFGGLTPRLDKNGNHICTGKE